MRRQSFALRRIAVALALLASIGAASVPARADTRRATMHGPRKLALYGGCAMSIAVAPDLRSMFAALSGCITLMINEA